MPRTPHPQLLLKQRPTDWSINVKEGVGGAERWVTYDHGVLRILPSPLRWLLLTMKNREMEQPRTEHLGAVLGH